LISLISHSLFAGVDFAISPVASRHSSTLLTTSSGVVIVIVGDCVIC